jgi:RimJ/RimL family protein N-acetyltransferase
MNLAHGGQTAMKNAFLIGEKTYLRAVDKDDAPALATWFNDPEVTRFLLRHRPMTVAQEEEFINKMQAGETDIILGIVTREEDRLIGCLGLHQTDARNRHSVFGISVGEKTYWGKGHGTEATRLLLDHAFATLNLNRVWLQVIEFNARAVRSYEKLGFKHEGRLRQHMYREGKYWDSLVMGILRSEWGERRSEPEA